MTVSAVLFDVDGTLVDSNYLHVDAWQRAFREVDFEADAWRIHRAIGQDSARLLRDVAGERDDDWMERAKDAHARLYREQADRLRAFASAPELLRAIAGRGINVVLATSAPEDELAMLREAIDADDAVHAATSADDVDSAKPDPGILNVALERAGSPAADALMVGDSVWTWSRRDGRACAPSGCAAAASRRASCGRRAPSRCSTTPPLCSQRSTACSDAVSPPAAPAARWCARPGGRRC